MKLCFSTLGCSDWTINDAYAAAKDLALGGIEIRRLDNERFAPDMRCFSDEKLPATAAMLNEGGVEIPLLAARAVFGDASGMENAPAEVESYCALAKKLSSPYVKISLNAKPTDDAFNAEFAKSAAERLCDIAKKYGVSLLINTDGAFSDTGLLAGFLNSVPRGNLFALWDTSYTFRRGETPAETLKNLGGAVKLVHLKDSVAEDGAIVNRPIGSGDVPIADAVRLLKNAGFDGWLSYEWKKSWGDEFASAGIVLSHFANYMARLEREM